MINIKKLAKTVIVVTAFSCVERALGFVYRIFLSRGIGAEGLGLYQIALSVIGTLMTISASGIPITVSRLMVKERSLKNRNSELSCVSAGMTATAAVCLPIVIALFCFKDKLGFLFADDRSVSLFLIILPGVFFTSVYAVIRGFFWGRKFFYTYSVIELAEEAVMMISGIILVLSKNGVYEKAKAAALAVLISYAFSFTASIITFFARGGKLKNPLPELKPLIVSSTPITLMRTATSLGGFLIALILPAALINSGISKSEAIASFGVISGMTMPLLFMPSTIIGSISLVLVPELAENFYKKQSSSLQANVEKSLLYSAVIALFIIPIFCACGKFIGSFVYENELSGIYLIFAAPAMLPMSITMISNSLLNSMGMERKTLLYFIIGGAFLILSIWLLPPYLGNYSLIVGYVLSFTITAVLNVRLLQKICCKKLAFIKKLLTATLICPLAGLACYFMFNALSEIIPEFVAFLSAASVTALCFYLTICALNVIDYKIDFKKLKSKFKRKNKKPSAEKNRRRLITDKNAFRKNA